MKNATYTLLALMAWCLSAWAAGKGVQVQVNGMVCAFCAQGLTKKFRAEEAVDKVDVDLTGKLVKIELKDGKDLSDDRIKTLIKDAGFAVEKIKR